MLRLIFSTLLSAAEITLLVVLLMTVVELLNIGSRGKIIDYIKKSPVRQVIISSLLGVIPGCAGGFASVSLYTHGVISIGALCSAMICSCGDEAFFLLATAPSEYLKIILILFPISVVAGFVVNLISKKTESCTEGLSLHTEDTEDSQHQPHKVKHFIKEHFLHHIVRYHLLSVFLWTFCALLACNILLEYCNLESFIEQRTGYRFIIILIAILIGMIPQSGPHLIFITLALNGIVPFYVVVVNLITAQGHVSLPLLSHSKRSWLVSKLICASVALIVGIVYLTIL